MRQPFYIHKPRNIYGELLFTEEVRNTQPVYSIHDSRRLGALVVDNITMEEAKLKVQELALQAHEDEGYAMYI